MCFRSSKKARAARAGPAAERCQEMEVEVSGVGHCKASTMITGVWGAESQPTSTPGLQNLFPTPLK